MQGDGEPVVTYLRRGGTNCCRKNSAARSARRRWLPGKRSRGMEALSWQPPILIALGHPCPWFLSVLYGESLLVTFQNSQEAFVIPAATIVIAMGKVLVPYCTVVSMSMQTARYCNANKRAVYIEQLRMIGFSSTAATATAQADGIESGHSFGGIPYSTNGPGRYSKTEIIREARGHWLDWEQL